MYVCMCVYVKICGEKEGIHESGERERERERRVLRAVCTWRGRRELYLLSRVYLCMARMLSALARRLTARLRRFGAFPTMTNTVSDFPRSFLKRTTRFGSRRLVLIGFGGGGQGGRGRGAGLINP